MKLTYRPFGSYIDSEIHLDSINIVTTHPETNVEMTVTLEDFISKMMYKIDQLEQYVTNDKTYRNIPISKEIIDEYDIQEYIDFFIKKR
jgi:hypothetical protein